MIISWKINNRISFVSVILWTALAAHLHIYNGFVIFQVSSRKDALAIQEDAHEV